MTTNRGMKTGRLVVLSVLLTLVSAVSQKVSAQCIPVESEVVRSTCGGCHLVDSHLCMSRISNQRKTPEGWEDTVRRMGRTNGVPSSASQAREIIGYLADNQGLSSSEVQDIAYALEKRRNVMENVPNEDVKNVCTRCHSYARIAGERRTREEWFKLKDFHLASFPEELNSPDWPRFRRQSVELSRRAVSAPHSGVGTRKGSTATWPRAVGWCRGTSRAAGITLAT